MSIQDRIKTIREELGLSQEKFGRRMGVSRDVINNLERGKVEPKQLQLNHMCDVYSINPAWLIDGLNDETMFLDTADSLIATVASKYGLSEFETKFLKEFLKLSAEERAVLEVLHNRLKDSE